MNRERERECLPWCTTGQSSKHEHMSCEGIGKLIQRRKKRQIEKIDRWTNRERERKRMLTLVLKLVSHLITGTCPVNSEKGK